MGQFATRSLFAQMSIIRDIVYGAVRAGASLKDVCDQAGLDASDLTESDVKIPFEQSIRVWEVCMKATSDKLLGLHLGERTGPLILGLVGHLMQSSGTLREAFKQVVTYNEIFTNLFEYGLKETRATTILIFQPVGVWKVSSPGTAQQAVDQAMAGTLSVFRMLSGHQVIPAKAEIASKRPKHWQAYEEAFGCAVQFECRGNQMIFDQRQLDAPVLSYDRSLFRSLSDLLEKAKASSANQNLTDKIHNLILTEFMGQAPTVEIVASRLSLTTRSLQRRLAAEHTSFRELVVATQGELARKFLSRKDCKISEVARLLGYSEASSFRRAFKSWTGNSPSKERQ